MPTVNGDGAEVEAVPGPNMQGRAGPGRAGPGDGGVSRNSGEPSLHFPSLLSRSRLSLPSPSCPLCFQPFPSPFLPPFPPITASAIAPPAGPDRARPPNAFLCNYSPKYVNLLKVLPTCTIGQYNINSYKLAITLKFVPVTTECLRYLGDQKLFFF